MHQETFELNCSRTSLALDSPLVVIVEMSFFTTSYSVAGFPLARLCTLCGEAKRV